MLGVVGLKLVREHVATWHVRAFLGAMSKIAWIVNSPLYKRKPNQPYVRFVGFVP